MRVLEKYIQMYNSTNSKIVLYMPEERFQILVDNYAHSLAIQAYMHIRNLDFDVKHIFNTEYMSQSGAVPVLRCDNIVLGGFFELIGYLKTKFSSLDENYVEDINAYLSYVDTTLTLSTLFMLWVDARIYKSFTMKRYGSTHSFPLRETLSFLKRRKIIQYLTYMDWHNYSNKQVIDRVNECCSMLSQKMDTKPYILGDSPSEVDALIYGYYYSILTLSPSIAFYNGEISPNDFKDELFLGTNYKNGMTKSFDSPLMSTLTKNLDNRTIDCDEISFAMRSTLLKYEKLVDLCYRIDKSYFHKLKSTKTNGIN